MGGILLDEWMGEAVKLPCELDTQKLWEGSRWTCTYFWGRKNDGLFGKKSGTVSSFTANCWSKFCSQTGIWIEGLFFYNVVAPNLSIGRAWWLDSFDGSVHRKFWTKPFFDKGTWNLWMSSIFGLFHPPKRGFFPLASGVAYAQKITDRSHV